MNIKEAATRYEVSRAKLHRMIRTGRLEAVDDPRDERATLLRADDLEALFRFPVEADLTSEHSARATGVVTAEARARVDAIRVRIAARGRLADDSVEIIREGRERRNAEVYRAATSTDEGNSGEA